VILNRAELLLWPDWSPQAKEYLATAPRDGIDLTELVAAYTNTVTHFNDWFGETFVERCHVAFHRVRAMEAEIAQALDDLDRSRA
jgi:hypothetical protein